MLPLFYFDGDAWVAKWGCQVKSCRARITADPELV